MVAVSKILGPNGQPIVLDDLKTPQTSMMQQLHHEFQGHPSRGLTPSKLANIMDRAEQGDTIAQFELYEDIEEKDGHVMAEMSKRRRAITGLDWSINPPKNANEKEQDNAQAIADLMEGMDDFEDVLFDLTDAIGKGFCCLEIEWHRLDGYWLPKTLQHRPQSWFQLTRGYTQTINLRGVGEGIPLTPFGWITHTHKAKSGFLERSALFRVLLWPYLFKNYSVGDLAEFLEIYGIPLRLGKYPIGATEKEKYTLMRALSMIGHNAAGIIPHGMEIAFHEAAKGDPNSFMAMIDWCEKTQSKAILGGTLTSQADGKTSTNALGSVHNEVRKELRDSDAKQIAKTISRDLVFAIATLNGLADNWQRCPRFKFDVTEPEDLAAFATSIPVLVDLGYKIDRQWAQQRVGIPEPEEGAELLARATPAVPAQPVKTDTAALSAQLPADIKPAGKPATMADQLDDALMPITDEWIYKIKVLVESADSMEAIRDGLESLLGDMDIKQYAAVFAEAMRVANLLGRYDVMQEAKRAQ